MFRPSPFQTAAHCWRFALRRASADDDTFHVTRDIHRYLGRYGVVWRLASL